MNKEAKNAAVQVLELTVYYNNPENGLLANNSDEENYIRQLAWRFILKVKLTKALVMLDLRAFKPLSLHQRLKLNLNSDWWKNFTEPHLNNLISMDLMKDWVITRRRFIV